ncbi:MAG TPA: GNAT family protein [Dokdonella sp.]|uniref:GNAT family N-acetyltransferase n=1 Tax=Dokdonella sp. TaxID=2291710 RepID=UPI002C8560B1|nr:GNAT family protein [Dokdonella sp.]HUD40643.1 GNAT family protein [Dokdonella sp.]
MDGFLTPVMLEGEHVVLEPLQAGHAEALAAAAADGELHRLWYTSVPAPGEMAAYVAGFVEQQAQRTALPFAVRLRGDGTVVGHTAICNADGHHRRLEIGYTWYAARVQRTAVNTEAKLLLLRHAFEALGCVRVEFRTHWFNHRSREAIARLGARQEGVLRSHQTLADGSLRDTVVFSIIEPEWPAVRRHLIFRLERSV